MSATLSLTEPKPNSYLPQLRAESTYSDSLSSDRAPSILRTLSPQGLHRPQLSHSLIHDVSDIEHIRDDELAEINNNMITELQWQIESHQEHSHNPLPNLESMRSLSLQLDSTMEPFGTKSSRDWTPTLKHKETKEICDKLDNINGMINDLNQYIMNHKSQKIKTDTFIQSKLTEIQDDIEDSQMYIEEHIDRKLIEMDHEHNMMALNTDRMKKDIDELQRRIHSLDNEKQQLFIKQQTQTSVISRLSTLSLINESPSEDIDRETESKEGNLYKETKDEERTKEIKNQKKIYNNYYQDMNQFILKITQPQFKLPRRVVDIIGETQSKLISDNREFVIELQQMDNGNDEAIYRDKYMEHKELINTRIASLRSLNMHSLQCKLDIMDVLNDKNKNKKYQYELFLDKFIHSISRIFFDANMILSRMTARTCTVDCENEEQRKEESVFISDQVMNVLNLIPLTFSMIELTDILLSSSSSTSSSSVCLDDLRVYVLNIEEFRLLLIKNGMNEYEFIESFAIKMIHSGMIKRNKHQNMKSQINVICDVFISIIVNRFGVELLSSHAFSNDVSSFIHFVAQIIKYPPILNQINISSHYKKKHKKHLKNILNESSCKQMDMNSAIKSYYNLYSNRSLIKRRRKFQRYIRCKQRMNRYSHRFSSSCSSLNSTDYTQNTDEEDESDEEDSYYDEIVCKREKEKSKEKEEIKSLTNVFNQLFVKCID